MYIVMERNTGGAIHEIWDFEDIADAEAFVERMFGRVIFEAREPRTPGQPRQLQHYYFWGETIVEVYKTA